MEGFIEEILGFCLDLDKRMGHQSEVSSKGREA